MTKIIAWIKNKRNQVGTWWSNHRQSILVTCRDIVDGINRVTRNITILMVIGIILNIVASYFYPELPERFPAIYGWFDGWLQFGEYAVETAFGGIYSLFTGNWNEFVAGNTAKLSELWSQFVAWLSRFA